MGTGGGGGEGSSQLLAVWLEGRVIMQGWIKLSVLKEVKSTSRVSP